MTQTLTPFEAWHQGDMAAEATLTELCRQLTAIEDRLDPMQETVKVLRSQISTVVATLGDKAEVTGFGKLENTPPTRIASYDKAELDRLVIQLSAEGHAEIAQAIARCKRETPRTGSLRITRTKE